jgi:succinoglycan biosynthesis transport protein ExoP
MSLEVQVKPQVLPPAEGRVPTLVSGGDRVTLMELWRVLMKRRYVILVVTILSLAGALWYALRTTPVFESMARIQIQPQQTTNIGIEELIKQKQGGGETQTDLLTEVWILQSDSVLFETAQSLNLLDRVRAESAALARKRGESSRATTGSITPMERRSMIDLIRNGLTAKVVNGTNLVEIRYNNQDPKMAAAIVNRLVETYQDEDLHTKFERTQHVSTWLQKQLDGLKTEASNAQQELADYQRLHNIVGTGTDENSDENSNLTLQTLRDISSSLDDAEADRIMKEVRMRDFDGLNSNMVALMGDNPNLATLRGHLQDLEAQRAQLATKYAPRHPQMVQLQTQIDKVQAQIDAEVGLARRQVHDEYESAAGLEAALRKRLETQEDAAYKLNEGAAQYAILRNQAELARDLYDTLQMRLKEASVTAGLSAANITVVDSAQVPYIPIAPRKRMSTLMGLIGGFLGGCVLAFLIESIDDRLQTSEEVENATMLPSLAAIPHLISGAETRKRRRKEALTDSANHLSRQLVALRDSKSVGAEAYRNLRSSLLLSSIDHPPRIIVVTSAFPKEGKTTTAINCAIVLAQRGEKVLLVDLDLRRGSLGAAFGISNRSIGLTTMLSNPDLLHDEIPAPLPELPTLHVLPTGPRAPNPAEMLSSTRMAEQLRQWSQEYDRIVLDTAPLLSVSDTQALAVFADTVVLVTRAGMTRRRALVRARDVLLRISAPIAGVVVNDVDVRLENFYTTRYGYGYGYGYGGGYGSPYSDRAYGYENEDEEKK